MEKEILLVNDLCGVGKVALSAMIPAVSARGHIVHTLPTALVSNTLDYNLFEIQDTTPFIEKTLDIWSALGFRFDCICTGFLVSQRQAELIRELFDWQPQALKIVDPILGDDGHLYPGVDPNAVDLRRQLVSAAQVVIPNLTEAALLCGHPEWALSVTSEQKKQLLDELCALGAEAAVMTSVVLDQGGYQVCGRDRDGHYFDLPFDMIDVRIPGTGDLFAGALACAMLSGADLAEACRRAMREVEVLISDNQHNPDLLRGVRIEKALAEQVRRS